MRESHDISPTDSLLLFFSHVTRQKGIHLLLEIVPYIVNRFPNTKLLVVGSGEYLGEAKKTVLDMGFEKEVLFIGHVAHEETAPYLNACDVFVLPTLRQEGLPFAILEAMACQKPVITSRIGGIPSVVTNQQNGILVTPGDVGELREAVCLLLDQPEVAADLARNARENIIQKLTSQAMVDRYLTIFEEVIENTG